MAFITQVLLPKCDNAGNRFPKDQYRSFHSRMIRRFGGWARKGQAEGAWLAPSGRFFVDQLWVYEIGHLRPDLAFWHAEKERLKEEFSQEEIWIVQYEGRMI